MGSAIGPDVQRPIIIVQVVVRDDPRSFVPVPQAGCRTMDVNASRNKHAVKDTALSVIIHAVGYRIIIVFWSHHLMVVCITIPYIFIISQHDGGTLGGIVYA
jgi:hypothetical protein